MKAIHSLAAASVLAAMSGLGFAASASAQDYEDEIVVPAPYEVHHRQHGNLVSVSARLSTRDLDLRDDNDVALLHQRIRDTAWDVCARALEALDGVSATTDRECVRRAVLDARPQERYLIDRARS
ncbi:MAG TPA: UrcA family protein [Caulobacterales bacterium]|nr:UrcA family protein [Caulobacterales bacterium]